MNGQQASRLSNLNRQVREMAEAGHGVVSVQEFALAGINGKAILRRRKSGLLVPVLRSVYALPGTRLDSRGRARAAMLAGGPGCVVSHGSALNLHGLVPERTPVHVTKTGGACRPNGVPLKACPEFGFKVHSHQSRTLDETRSTVIDGIRVTTVERALVEYSAYATPAEIGKALSQGEREQNLCWEKLDRLVRSSSGHPGVRRLRSEIAFFHSSFALAESDPEEDLLRLLRRRPLPMPEPGVWFGNYRLDFFWRHLQLAVELDPYSTHAGAASHYRDRRKGIELEAAGIRAIRLAGYDIYENENRTLAEIESIMRDQASRLGVDLYPSPE